MRSHRKPLIGNFSVRGFVVYGGWGLGDWEIGRHQRLFSPSFLWKEVPRRGGGWPRETVLPHSGKPTPPRFARLPLPEEGARMIFKETLIQSLSFAVKDSHFPHICRALLRFPHLSFMPPVPYPPLRGTFPSRGRLAIRGKPAINRLSGIAPFRHPERRETSYVR